MDFFAGKAFPLTFFCDYVSFFVVGFLYNVQLMKYTGKDGY